MRKLALFVLLLASAGLLFAQKKPLTIADLYRIKSVDDPQYSPDGRKIAFVVKTDTLATGTSNNEIYVMDSEGTSIVKRTDNAASDTRPRWSPDGTSILFLSTRKDGTQAWLLPAEGGDPRQLTDFSPGVDKPIWSPDGKHIAFCSDVFPDCGADDSCNKSIDESMTGGPLQAHMADHLLYRHWTTWRDGKRTHIILFDIEKKTYTDLTPGDFDAPHFMLGGEGFAFSPDGAEICYASNHDPDEARTTNKDLWVVPVAGGNATDISASNKAYDGDPAYSPDGRYIAYRMQTIPGYESDRFRIALYDRKAKGVTVLTDAFDNWVDDFVWAPDSRSIYFTGEMKAHVPLYKIDILSKAITPIVDVRTIDAFCVSPDGKQLAFTRRSIAEPREIWSCGAGGDHLRRLTTFNKKLEEEIDIRPAQELWIASPTGAKIQTFVVTPHNFDPAKKYPLILNVHGGPQGAWLDGFRGDWQVYPGSGYIVAFPNPHGSTGFGQEFTAEISKDWTGDVYKDVMAVADSLSRISWVDKDRMGAMGWSYGGYMMMWFEGHTERFKAIACMMGVYDLPAMHGGTEELWFPEWELGGEPWNSSLYEKLSPNRSVRNFKTPCLVITGEQDLRVPYTQSLEFFTDLQEMGVPSRLIVFKNDGHWPSTVKSMPFYYNAHLDWFHRYLGGDPAPYDMQKMWRNKAFLKE